MQLQADEELGKRDDDHGFPKQRRFRPFLRSNIARSRRVVVLLVVCIILYQFFKHMPTDLTPAAERYNPPITKPRPSNPGPSGNPSRYPANSKIDNEIHDMDESYESPIRFDYLAQSLPNREYPKGQASNSVIFAGSSLRCISDLLPLACRMGSSNLNQVHFILLGRDEVTIEGIKQVNGVTDRECPIAWHGQSIWFFFSRYMTS